MATAIGGRFVLPIMQVVDSTGVPYNGAKLFFYATGTSTDQQTFSDSALTVPNPQPVLTNAQGMFPQIFMLPAPAYRVRLLDPTDAIVWDCDPVSGLPGVGTAPGYVPVGSIMPFAGGAPPSGWLFADGSLISRTVFSVLFAVIGTTYGAGDGATTFAVPDLRGRVAAGADSQGGVAAGRLTFGNSGVAGDTLGASGGSELSQAHNHTLTDPGHNHTTNDAGHAHEQQMGQGSGSTNAWNITGTGALVNMDIMTEPATTGITNNGTTTGITIDSFGSGSSQNVQPTIVTLYVIFAG
jgi:microcystin-dependent protein